MRSDSAGNADSLLAKGKAGPGLLTLALAAFVLAIMPPASARAQNWDGAGGGGGYSLPPPPGYQPGKCVYNCDAAPAPAAPTYQAPARSAPSYSGPSPMQQQMMSNYMQGAFDLGSAIGDKIRRSREEAAREEPIQENQEEAARQAAEAARKAEEERRHQQLMANLKDIDGIGAVGEQVRLKGIDDASGAGRPLQLKTGNDPVRDQSATASRCRRG
jgi:hypothetical protein